MSQPDKQWKTMIDITSGSFVTLEIEGQVVQCIMGYNIPRSVLWFYTVQKM